METFEVGKVIVQKAESWQMWEVQKLRKRVRFLEETTVTPKGTVAIVLGLDFSDPKEAMLDLQVGNRYYRTHVVDRNVFDVWGPA